MNILQIGSPLKKIGGVSNHIEIIKKNKVSKKINYEHLYLTKNKSNNFDIRYNIFNLLTKIFKFKKICKKKNIDVIHAHTQRAALLVVISKYLSLNKINIIYTPHGFRHLQKKNIFKIIHLIFEKIILNGIDHIFILTKNELDFLKKIKFKNYTFLNNVIDIKNYSGNKKLRKKNNKQKIVINIANMDKIKQPNLFIKIAKKVTKKNKNIVFYWIGKINSEYKNRVIKNKNIVFTGYLNRKNIATYLRSCDLFLLTSKFETFPYVFLEASFFKKKILVNKFYTKNKFYDFKNISTFKFNDSNDGFKKVLYHLYKKNNKNSNSKLNTKYINLKKFIFIIENQYLSFRKTKVI